MATKASCPSSPFDIVRENPGNCKEMQRSWTSFFLFWGVGVGGKRERNGE